MSSQKNRPVTGERIVNFYDLAIPSITHLRHSKALRCDFTNGAGAPSSKATRLEWPDGGSVTNSTVPSPSSLQAALPHCPAESGYRTRAHHSRGHQDSSRRGLSRQVSPPVSISLDSSDAREQVDQVQDLFEDVIAGDLEALSIGLEALTGGVVLARGDHTKALIDESADAETGRNSLSQQTAGDALGIILNSVDEGKMSLFHVACMNGHLDIAKYLLGLAEALFSTAAKESGEGTSGSSNPTSGPLKVSSQHLSEAVGCFDVPLEGLAGSEVRKALVNRVGGYAQQTPLHLAAYNSHVDIVRLLLEYGQADPFSVSKNGSTPLHLVAAKNVESVEVARMLLVRARELSGSTGPKRLINMTNKWGVTAVSSAETYGHRSPIFRLVSGSLDDDVSLSTLNCSIGEQL